MLNTENQYVVYRDKYICRFFGDVPVFLPIKKRKLHVRFTHVERVFTVGALKKKEGATPFVKL